MTCWRRLRDWHVAGVWEKIWRLLLDELGLADQIDWSTSAIDSCSVRASFWGAKTGPNPTDRGKNGSKRHLMVDGTGTPLAIAHTGANCHDSEMAIPLVDAVPPIKQPRGAPRKRPDEVLADRAYDAEAKIRKPLRKRGIKPLLAHRNTEHGSGLGKFRYVVEACFDWLFNWRRLRVRYEKRPDIHDAFLIHRLCHDLLEPRYWSFVRTPYYISEPFCHRRSPFISPLSGSSFVKVSLFPVPTT